VPQLSKPSSLDRQIYSPIAHGLSASEDSWPAEKGRSATLGLTTEFGLPSIWWTPC